MSFEPDYLEPTQTYIQPQTGRPTLQFMIFWQKTMNGIKAAFTAITATAADVTALALRVTGLEAVPYVTIGNSSATSAERALAATTPIVLTDGGANGSATLSHATSGVTAGPYGSGSLIPRVVVDARGHVTSVTEIAVALDGAAVVPLSMGSEPLTFVSDGAGQPILVPYTP